jgi:copper transport protein
VLAAPDSQRFTLSPAGDSSNAKILQAVLPPLALAGRYGVEWRLIGPDGHAVSGRYSFTIDSIPAPVADTAPSVDEARLQPEVHDPPGDSALQRVVRFLVSLSMVVIIGAVAFALFVLPAVRHSGIRTDELRANAEARTRSLAMGAAWLLLVLAAVRLTSHAAVLGGSLGAVRMSDLGDVTVGSMFGRGLLLQVVAVIGLLALLRPRAPRWSALAYASGALAISASFLGHPAAVPDVPAVAMSLDAVHVIAAGGWAGSIVILALVGLPQLRSVPAAHRLEAARDVLRAFSPLALASASILVVTGVVNAWLQLRVPGMLFGSEYGLVLVRKTVVVAFIAALGAYHWKVVQPALDSAPSLARLRLSLALDVAFVLLVLLFTAVLMGTAPPIR